MDTTLFSFLATLKPGVSRSTRKAVIPLYPFVKSALAKIYLFRGLEGLVSQCIMGKTGFTKPCSGHEMMRRVAYDEDGGFASVCNPHLASIKHIIVTFLILYCNIFSLYSIQSMLYCNIIEELTREVQKFMLQKTKKRKEQITRLGIMNGEKMPVDSQPWS